MDDVGAVRAPLRREHLLGEPAPFGTSVETYTLDIDYAGGSGLVLTQQHMTLLRPEGRLTARRIDDMGRPIDARPIDVAPLYPGSPGRTRLAAVAPGAGFWLLVWSFGADPDLLSRRLGTDGIWIDVAPRPLPSGLERRAFDFSLTAVPGGFLLLTNTGRGLEVARMDARGVTVSRRLLVRGGASIHDMACGTSVCLVAYWAGDTRILLVDPAGRPLQSGASVVTAPAPGALHVAESGGSFLVVGRGEPSWAVRVSSSGGILDTPPLAPSSCWWGCSVSGGSDGWLLATRDGRAQRVRLDGTLELPSTAVAPASRVQPESTWTGSRWLITGDEPSTVVAFAPDEPVGPPQVVGERFADAFDFGELGTPRVASNGAHYFVAWREIIDPGVGPASLRASVLDSDGVELGPRFERGPSASFFGVGTVAAAGSRFVLAQDDQLWVFESDGTLRSGPHGTPDARIGCADSGCLVGSTTGWTPFDPTTGAFGALVPDTAHTLVSGPAGHLDVWPAGFYDLFARRIGGDGRAIDASPIAVATDMREYVVAPGTDGWVFVYRATDGRRVLVRLRADGTLTSAPLDPSIPRTPVRLTCRSGTCWLVSTDTTTTTLTLLDESGTLLAGPSPVLARQAPQLTLDGATAIGLWSDGSEAHVAMRPFATVFCRDAPNGEPCSSGAECASGHCADGVCCVTACDAADDCMACSVESGGTEDGRCTPMAAGRVCRAGADVCDRGETCDGTSGACPTDEVFPAGTVCRAGDGPCDLVEACDGTSTACPVDAFDASLTCRAATDLCDAEERCDGAMALCEADGVQPVGSVCRASAGACDLEETCDGVTSTCAADVRERDGTSCDDGDVCNGAESCSSGACLRGVPLDCNDRNTCTTDTCHPVDGCQYELREPCCRRDSDCDDGDACTRNVCVDGDCRAERRPSCCHADAECEDGIPCTRNDCVAWRCVVRDFCREPAPDAGPSEPPPATSGCGCRAVSERPPESVPLLALILLLARRRRL